MSLIFQSAMATSIAAMCAAAGYRPEEALGTTLVTLVIATFVAGVLIMLVGARVGSGVMIHGSLKCAIYRAGPVCMVPFMALVFATSMADVLIHVRRCVCAHVVVQTLNPRP